MVGNGLHVACAHAPARGCLGAGIALLHGGLAFGSLQARSGLLAQVVGQRGGAGCHLHHAAPRVGVDGALHALGAAGGQLFLRTGRAGCAQRRSSQEDTQPKAGALYEVHGNSSQG